MTSEPRAITFKQVGDRATWEKIGEISGAGSVPLNTDGDASIDLTDVSESKRSRIEALLQKQAEADQMDAEEVTIDESKRSTKRGKQ